MTDWIKRHSLLLLAVLLIGLKTLFIILFSYQSIMRHKHAELTLMTQMAINERMSAILYDQSNGRAVPDQASQNPIGPHFAITLRYEPRLLKYDLRIPATQLDLSRQQIQLIQRTLDQSGSMVLATYLPREDQWLHIRLVYNSHYVWQETLSLVLIGALFIALILGVMFLYLQHALPNQIAHLLRQGDGQSARAHPLVKDLYERIQAHIDEKHLMLSALSHDIRTPLTRAGLKCDLLPDPKESQSIRQDLTEIEQIIKTSLDYAKDPKALKKVPVELVSMIEALIEPYQNADFHVTFDSALPECSIAIEPNLFKRLIQNIMDNAKKYAQACHISLSDGTDHLTLSISDNGPGVPEQYLDALCKPFFRVDASRSRASGGMGLGLAIAKKVVSAHHGALSFENTKEGFRVCIKLPLKTSNPEA